MWAVPEIYYIKETGDDATGDGLAMSTAWKTPEKFWKLAGKADGAICLCANDIAYTTLANSDGVDISTNLELPTMVMGWPKAGVTGITANFTNGSRSVTNVAGVSMDWLIHRAKTIITPDGKPNQIIKVVSATEFVLKRLYAGTTATVASWSIDADPFYAWAQALGAGDGADDVATWDAMATRATINAGHFFRTSNTQFAGFSNINIIQSIATITLSMRGKGLCYNLYMKHPGGVAQCYQGTTFSHTLVDCCLEGTTDNNICRALYRMTGVALYLKRVVFPGMGGTPIDLQTVDQVYADDCAIGVVDTAVRYLAYFYIGKVTTKIVFNRCVFQAPTGAIMLESDCGLYTNKLSIIDCEGLSTRVLTENVGTVMSNDGSGADVNLRSGGSPTVLDVLQGTNYSGYRDVDDSASDIDNAWMPFKHKIWFPAAGSKSLEYYMQSVNDALTAQQAWIEIESDTGIVKSSSTIAARAGADDWTQKLTGTGTMASAGWLIVRVFLAFYDATDKRYYDWYAGGLDGYEHRIDWSDGPTVISVPSDVPIEADVAEAVWAYANRTLTA